MMIKDLKPIHTTALKCNCPECFSATGLVLTYKQEWKENFWYKKATDVVREDLFCTHCNFPIYPVKWTSDIEMQYEYNLKLAEKEKYFKLKPEAYFVIFAALVLIGVGVYAILVN